MPSRRTCRRSAAGPTGWRPISDALIEHVTRVRSEASRLAVLLTGAWEDREALRRQATQLEAALARLRVDLQQANARARYLERRATERAVGGTPPGTRGTATVPVQTSRRAGELASPQ